VHAPMSTTPWEGFRNLLRVDHDLDFAGPSKADAAWATIGPDLDRPTKAVRPYRDLVSVDQEVDWHRVSKEDTRLGFTPREFMPRDDNSSGNNATREFTRVDQESDWRLSTAQNIEWGDAPRGGARDEGSWQGAGAVSHTHSFRNLATVDPEVDWHFGSKGSGLGSGFAPDVSGSGVTPIRKDQQRYAVRRGGGVFS
jgi:hypothetical protein